MPPKELRDNVSRTKAPSLLGKTIFVGLRAADVLWQYNLIYSGLGARLIAKLGGRTIPPSPALQPYYSLVSLLSLGSSIKQIAHITLVSEQEMSAGSGLTIAAFNTIFNTLNTLLSLWTLASPASSLPSTNLNPTATLLTAPLITIGITAYTIGILTETISEFQRKSFKQNPSNKGKPYGDGLFSLATNINYGGYTVWRAGYALACGGLANGIATFGFFFYDFAARGVPVLEGYLTERYGEQFLEIKERVKYSLIPWVY